MKYKIRKPGSVQPLYQAFLNAHSRREPFPWSAYVYREWLMKMYDLFMQKKDHGRLPMSTLDRHMSIHWCQTHGFEGWLLEESVKSDCPRDAELMEAENDPN